MNSDEEESDASPAVDAQMAPAGDQPDVEPEADTRGKVTARRAVRAAQPVATPAPPPARRGFFQRLFGGRSAQSQPTPTPLPRRR